MKLAEMQELKPPLGVGDKGSFMPQLEDDKEALATLDEAIKEAGYEGKVKIGLDIAASTFCQDGIFIYRLKLYFCDLSVISLICVYFFFFRSKYF